MGIALPTGFELAMTLARRVVWMDVEYRRLRALKVNYLLKISRNLPQKECNARVIARM